MNYWKLHWKEAGTIAAISILASFALIVFFLKSTDAGVIIKKTLNCMHFANAEYPLREAKKALAENPNLDRDKDGIPCEMYNK